MAPSKTKLRKAKSIGKINNKSHTHIKYYKNVYKKKGRESQKRGLGKVKLRGRERHTPYIYSDNYLIPQNK